MTAEVTATKKRSPRKPMTEFGNSFNGFIRTVNFDKLAIRVGALTGETDKDKVQSTISSLMRRASQKNGVVSKRSEAVVNAILQAVVELDPDMAAKAATLKKQFVFENVASGSREPGQNWLVRLKSGLEVPIKEGPEGDGVYILQKVGEYPTNDEDGGEDAE